MYMNNIFIFNGNDPKIAPKDMTIPNTDPIKPSVLIMHIAPSSIRILVT